MRRLILFLVLLLAALLFMGDIPATRAQDESAQTFTGEMVEVTDVPKD